MRLNVVAHGQGGERPPLLIVHGLFGSARNWGVIAKRLSAQRRVLAVDMRNHGDSPFAERHRYPDLAADLAGVIEGQRGAMDVLGHSMGGKAAMWLALNRPELVNRLVVADIAPAAYGHSQRHLIEAMQALPIETLSSRAEADRLLAATVAEAPVRAFLLQSLDLRSQPPRWRLNLDTLAREMDHITGWPDAAGLTPFEGASLFLAGATSDYVRPEHRETIRSLFPRARMAKLAGAGHWLHAEKPREFEQVLRSFLT
ncbi:MAG: alpha/beta fold hydrolase [Pararhodobacter sp.]|nr:alpha/beta fold hydrolase [Pararhodobacter sp.]